MSITTCENIIEFMESIQATYQRKINQNLDLPNFTNLIKEMRKCALEQGDGLRLQNENNAAALEAVISVLENAFDYERKKFCNGFLLGEHTDQQFTHYLKVHTNNHYPKLLGLALKQIYDWNLIVPQERLQKIVNCLDRALFKEYNFPQVNEPNSQPSQNKSR